MLGTEPDIDLTKFGGTAHLEVPRAWRLDVLSHFLPFRTALGTRTRTSIVLSDVPPAVGLERHVISGGCNSPKGRCRVTVKSSYLPTDQISCTPRESNSRRVACKTTVLPLNYRCVFGSVG